MAAMGLLRVLLTALLAFSASLEVQSNGDEQYMVSAGGERCNGASIGQNMHMSRAYPNYPIVNVTRVIENGWWAEKKYYNYTTLGCTAGKLCGHYTQVVWSNSVEVGCTIAQCPEVTVPGGTPWTNAAMFVCDYNP
ncbi:Pathogenesis-related protein PRMS, partial [Lamellibrachia satsuma]